MKVSVIVPVYKVEVWLDHCLESLLAQTHRDFEVLLVDDGSPDACPARCDDWGRRDGRIRVFHKPNGGLSSARNYALDRIAGEAITFVDSDDFVRPDYLRHLVALLEANPRAAYAETAVSVRRGNRERPRDDSGYEETLSACAALERVLYDDALFTSACAKLFRRDFLASYRFADGKLYEEILLAAEYMPRAGQVAYGGFPDYVYCIRDNSITTAAFDVSNLCQHLAASDALGAAAEALDPTLRAASLRYRTFSRLRALRFLPDVRTEEARTFGRMWREEALKNARRILSDGKTPLRDRIALHVLRLGLGPYLLAWKLYTGVRG